MNSSPFRPTCLQLLRHGEVEESFHHVFGGRIDMNLSPRGQNQAESLAQHLLRRPPEVIYSSPMKRARQTLDSLVRHLGKSGEILVDMIEVDFGDWSGLRWDQVLDRFGVEPFEWLNQLSTMGMPHGETAPIFRARIEPCLRGILNRHPGQTVALVCHGGVIRMILSILLELPLPKTAQFDLDYASLTEIEIHPNRVELRLLNFAPWRELS